ncbi:7-cyano-7-deazaguanine synthase QueC [Maridesulfovibrio sp. FT414]|uniref:7-cyano-7-deazaguanine synthase QueC n=1 Tax=Maridesulfovibrio sp. FT414 TaxID=2979469 RepID=UPI003D8072C7
MNNSALVVFSGGQDSTTCLAWALQRFDSVATIGFSYGQRHNVEMDCRENVLSEIRRLSEDWDQRLKHDQVLEIGLFNEIGGTALTEEVEISMGENGLPTTFVPGRNLVFLTAAAAYAYRQGIRHIIIGVCETDFSGYPDCRDDTIKAMQVALNLGMESRFVIHTPLMWIDKAETWTMADVIGGPAFVDLVREHTHTCYLGDRSELHEWGYGCGTCPACELRARGWEQFQAGKNK